MFDIATIIKNNVTSSQRETTKSQALASGKDYIQISVRKQRNNKQYINAILFSDKKPDGTQLNKQKALEILIDYCSDKTLPNTVYSVNATLVKEFKDYLNKKH